MTNKQAKHLYSFNSTDAQGKDRKFCILKPTRKMKEDGELYYASKLSQFISSGILPKIVWDKIFKDNGGIISETDKKEYSDLFVQLAELRNSINSLSVKLEKDRTEQEQFKIEVLEGSAIEARKRMQELEMSQINAFENTAEAKARNRTIVWWAATLAAEELEDAVNEPLLGTGSVDEKLDNYELIVESDEFLSDVFSRINYLVTVWYLGSATSVEDFKSLDEEYVNRIKSEEQAAAEREKLEDKVEVVEDVKVEVEASSLIFVDEIPVVDFAEASL
jgi:hypothetical protein